MSPPPRPAPTRFVGRPPFGRDPRKEVPMTRAAAACLALLALAACNKRNNANNDNSPETGTTHSADTIVTKREMQDTAVVSYEPPVSTDTVHKRGTKPADMDTVHH